MIVGQKKNGGKKRIFQLSQMLSSTGGSLLEPARFLGPNVSRNPVSPRGISSVPQLFPGCSLLNKGLAAESKPHEEPVVKTSS